MENNVGKTDKIIRYIIGVIIIVLGIVYSSWWGIIGLIPILTAAFGKCLLYKSFNFSTRKTKNDK